MRKAAIHICISLALILMTQSVCFGGSIIYGNSIDVYGGLKVKDNSLCFPDGTCMTSAIVSDGTAIWGQISGLISNQTDLQNQLNLKEDKANKGAVNGYASLDSSGRIPRSQIPVSNLVIIERSTAGFTPEWQLDFSNWTEDISWQNKICNGSDCLTSPIQVLKTESSTTLDISWTDSVGTYSSSWCNIGIFLDEQPHPVCFGSWLGTYGFMTFNQQSLRCIVNASQGLHIVKVKHRSQHCAYGNYPSTGDSHGTQRLLTIRELH